jgi:hypothetical protein
MGRVTSRARFRRHRGDRGPISGSGVGWGAPAEKPPGSGKDRDDGRTPNAASRAENAAALPDEE